MSLLDPSDIGSSGLVDAADHTLKALDHILKTLELVHRSMSMIVNRVDKIERHLGKENFK